MNLVAADVRRLILLGLKTSQSLFASAATIQGRCAQQSSRAILHTRRAMNKALLFLYCTLLRRKVLHFCRDLRRPVNLVSTLIVCSLLGVLVYHRNDEEFVKFITHVPLWFVLSLLLVVSLFRGFIQRGLAFESADVELLFTGPFKEYHLIFYRLLSGYLYSVVTGLVVLGLVGPHLEHPLLVTFASCFSKSSAFIFRPQSRSLRAPFRSGSTPGSTRSFGS